VIYNCALYNENCRTICEIFDFLGSLDLETRVRGHSRSLKIIPAIRHPRLPINVP